MRKHYFKLACRSVVACVCAACLVGNVGGFSLALANTSESLPDQKAVHTSDASSSQPTQEGSQFVDTTNPTASSHPATVSSATSAPNSAEKAPAPAEDSNSAEKVPATGNSATSDGGDTPFVKSPGGGPLNCPAHRQGHWLYRPDLLFLNQPVTLRL